MAKRKQLPNAGKPRGGLKHAKKGPVEDEEDSQAGGSDGAPGGSESGESEAEDEASDDEGSGPEEQNDGLADMMSKILNQNIGSKVFTGTFPPILRIT